MKRTPFSVSNGRNHGNSLAAKRASDLALVNGTSEGALKGWETRRAGGGGGMSAARSEPSMNDHPANKDWNKRVRNLEDSGLDTSDAQSVADVEWKQHGRFLANKLAAATKPADALANGEFKLFKKGQNSLGDIAADESKDKEEDAKDGGIDEEKEGEGANKKMANGEFVLFKKGQNSLGDIKDDAKKEPEDKDGKGPNDDGDEEDKDGKKAWVPPWKKDGVKNAAKPASESDALATKLTAATKPVDSLANGKPCGDSHIPDDHQCRDGGGVVELNQGSIPSSKAALKAALIAGLKPESPEKVEVRVSAEKASKDARAKSKAAHRMSDESGDIEGIKAHHDAMLSFLSAAKLNDEAGLAGQAKFHREDAKRHEIEKRGLVSLHGENGKRIAETLSNAGNSAGAHEGWLTRRGGVRAGDTFDHESGSGKHVKLTIQGQIDGQKNIELDLPKDVHTAIAAGSWKPNADFEKNSRGEDFHTIHGYEPVTKPGGIREKYGKGSEPDKANGLIGQNVSRAKAYYARARDFGDGTEAQNALKAKAESILKEIHSKYHPALVKAKAAHASSLGNRAYGALLNSFRGGLLKNYQHDVQEMLDEVADYASNGETLPDDLREQYEEWMDEQN